MRAKLIFAFPLFLFLFVANVSFAQYPDQNAQMMQTDTQPGSLHRYLGKEAKIDVARVDGLVHLTASQKTQLQQMFAKIERQKYSDNKTTNPNKVAPAILNKEVVKEENEAVGKVLTLKQLKSWKQTIASVGPSL